MNLVVANQLELQQHVPLLMYILTPGFPTDERALSSAPVYSGSTLVMAADNRCEAAYYELDKLISIKQKHRSRAVGGSHPHGEDEKTIQSCRCP